MNNNKAKIRLWEIIVVSLFAILLYIYEIGSSYANFSKGNSIIDVSFLLLFFITLFFSFPINHFRNKLSRIAVSFFILVIVVSVVHVISVPFDRQLTFFCLIYPVLVFYSMPKFGRTDVFLWCLCCVFFLIVFYYFRHYSTDIIDLLDNKNSAPYTILYLSPFLLCLRNNVVKYLGMFVVLVVLLFSMKRGGLISFAIAFFSYVVASLFISRKHFSKLSIYGFIIIMTLLMILLIIGVNDTFDNMLLTRFQSLENDEGSGRLEIWRRVIRQIEASPWSLIFGNGWKAVEFYSKDGSAHNDFLEILFNFGVFVFFVFILLFVNLVWAIRHLLTNKSKYGPVLLYSSVILFFNSIVSHVLTYPHFMALYALLWGYIISKTKMDLSSANSN